MRTGRRRGACSTRTASVCVRGPRSVNVACLQHAPYVYVFVHAHRWEEYFDYIFPDENKPQALKILEMAQKWKKQKTADE